MRRILKSILSRVFSNKTPAEEEEDETLESGTHLKGKLVVILSDHEMTEGAVAVVRVSSSVSFNSKRPDRLRQEFVYYPDESEVFFIMVTSSLGRSMDVTIHTNKDPATLGFYPGPGGVARIIQVEQLGRA